jgi:site-specific recombinase XerC
MPRLFASFAGRIGKRPSGVTTKDMAHFIRELRESGRKAAYVANRFVFLRRFFDYLETIGRVRRNPARGTFARAEKHEPRWFADDELLRTCRSTIQDSRVPSGTSLLPPPCAFVTVAAH